MQRFESERPVADYVQSWVRSEHEAQLSRTDLREVPAMCQLQLRQVLPARRLQNI